MDCFALLKQDHDEVAELIKKCQHEGAKKGAADTFKKIARALAVHTKLEETLFYPRFREREEFKSLLKDAYKEHDKVDHILEAMAGMSPDDEQWSAKLEELEQCVAHHVKDEEKELFPKASTVLDKDGARELGEEMADEKKEMMKGGHGTKEVFQRLGL